MRWAGGRIADRNGSLFVEGVSLESLARKYGTPLYVYSENAFLDPLKRIQTELKGMRATVCFAMKANSNLSILKSLVRNGAGLDLVSGGELARALAVKCPREKIVFSGVGKNRDEIAQALRAGIHSFNVESVAELRLIEAVARSMRKKARVALRFNPDVDPKTHPYISTGLKKNKFGLEKSEILAIASEFGKSKEIHLAGLSVHIGSQILSLKPFADSFRKMGELALRLEDKLGRKLEFMDLGGGLGVTYENEKPPAIEDYCALIRKTFGPKGLYPGYEIYLEPGRQIAANAGILLSRVLYRKPRSAKDFLVIDAAMNDLMRPSLYSSHHEIVPVRASRRTGKASKTDIVGPVCESSDCLAADRRFPDQVEADDLVAILSAGAYGMTMSSQYNSRPRAAEVLVTGKRAKLIRKRESFRDLIRNEVLS